MQGEDWGANVVGFIPELLCHGVRYCEGGCGCPAAEEGFVVFRYYDKRVLFASRSG